MASGIGEKPFSVTNLMMHLIPVIVAAVPAAIAWRWPATGGALLMALGLALGGLMLLGTLKPHPFTVVILVIPPIISGILFLVSGRPVSSAG